MRLRIDGLVLVAIGLIMVMAVSLISDRASSAASPPGNPIPTPTAAITQAPPITYEDPATFEAPYDRYTVTQGPHGSWYGHMAIDIAAGKDTAIKSPISGMITDQFIDQWGNPNLVIENEVYRVTLMHGIYSVSVNTEVELGQIIGNESNIGYTTDMQGNLCAGRDCGYHTHLNVFDKRLGENINPLELLTLGSED
jgi:murein DD-endopeptidase MepM/ murein hydrolase activator NlpD